MGGYVQKYRYLRYFGSIVSVAMRGPYNHVTGGSVYSPNKSVSSYRLLCFNRSLLLFLQQVVRVYKNKR